MPQKALQPTPCTGEGCPRHGAVSPCCRRSCGGRSLGAPFPAWLGGLRGGSRSWPCRVQGCPVREGKPGAEGCLSGSPALLGVQQFSTQHLCLLSGEAECPFHGNLASSGTAGPGKLSRAALPVFGEHQAGLSANQESRKLLSWASYRGLSPPGRGD